MSGLVLDAGALIAIDRRDRRVASLLRRALDRKAALVVPAGAVAQAWRDGATQVLLAKLLGMDEIEIEVLDDTRARSAGQLLGVRDRSDVVDASVVLCARSRKFRVVTSDPEDLAALDPKLELIAI